MNINRRNEARLKREEAARMANQRPHYYHISNGDEQKFRHDEKTSKFHTCSHDKSLHVDKKPSYLVSYTKGLPHNEKTGLVNNPDHFQLFVKAIDSGDPRDFRDTPLGFDENTGNIHSCEVPMNGWKSLKAQKGKLDAKSSDPDNPVSVRAWESQSAGLAYDLEGPDAQSVTMPPLPKLGSAELTAEMGELYVQALLRDVPFNAFTIGAEDIDKRDHLCADGKDVALVEDKVKALNCLDWFSGADVGCLTDSEKARRRIGLKLGTAFRGITPGDDIGPYISQFLLAGNTGINDKDTSPISPSEGYISYGAIRTDQRVRVAEKKDYLTKWEEWLDAQNGADFRKFEAYNDNQKHRFIFTPRDIATYVHYDALYEAYLNACLILLGQGVGFDPGIPFQDADNRDHQQGFAHFGGPHILSLVTEVATRALKAVRFQKYNVHRRCRPEVLAARIHKRELFEHMSPELQEMAKDLDKANILDHVANHNGNSKNFLLPMAFCEGSPMHPAYGAGHATVAGACVTVLKAFFDHKRRLCIVPENEFPKGKKGKSSNFAYVSVENGKKLKAIPVYDQDCNLAHLTVEGELNKLASNIAIGRDWAGVHYFTDYYESLLMGEKIALGILEEQKLMFGENFSMTVPLFDGTSRRI
ncbi:MAG: vanadium-dependent haloperoxidase [Bacteroidia bacterium]